MEKEMEKKDILEDTCGFEEIRISLDKKVKEH